MTEPLLSPRERLGSLLAPGVLEALEELVAELVAERVQAVNGAATTKRWLTPAEVAAYLGCSRNAVYERVRVERIPPEAVKRSGRSVLLGRHVLDRSLERSQ